MKKQIFEIDPKDIVIGWRVRLDPGDINELAASILEHGQMQPIAVKTNGDNRLELISGERRIQACRQLQRKVLAVLVEPKDELQALDMQLDENLRRKDFDDIERGLGLAQRKMIYEKLHPETKVGGAGRGRPKSRMAKSDNLTDPPREPAERFTKVTAKRFGIGETKVKEMLAIVGLSAKPKFQKRMRSAKDKPVAERNRIYMECLQEHRRDKKMERLKAEADKKAELQSQAELNDQGEVAETENARPIHVYHDDCLKLMATWPKESVDLVASDPPFGRARSQIAHIARASINPEEHKWDKLDVGWVMLAAPLLVPGGQLLTFCPLEKVGDYEVACEAAGLDYRMAILWCKTNPGPAHRPTYVSAVEAIVWAVKPGKAPYFKPWEGKSTDGDYHPMNWFESPICGGRERLHPTQKPLAVMLKLLHRHASPELNHRVLDPFAGAGTTGVACRQMGLSAILIEKDETYLEMIRARMAAQ